ncbi:Histone H2A deubiquitinase MYSM1 [Eumeta japonica]|uniref:Histone H2A deubiquitinase MYSM1 n=1 Tax=Eumeta variegata TaxID=151549 RepID=A0A4C2A002_EUMVA|nr:Histone H2A deubiquitinase MYSM1 [Eumeta japonica]
MTGGEKWTHYDNPMSRKSCPVSPAMHQHRLQNQISMGRSPADSTKYREESKYGRDIRKISQTLTTKTETEIQALIEAEYGINLDPPGIGVFRPHDGSDDEIPPVVQEEVVTEDDTLSVNNVLSMVTTGSPTIPFLQIANEINRATKKNSANKLLKPEDSLNSKKNCCDVIKMDSRDLIFDDELAIGSTEYVGSDDSIDYAMDIDKCHPKMNIKKEKIKKKIGNHRMKALINKRNHKQKFNKSESVKFPQKKDPIPLEGDTKTQKMQILLGSGQALPLCEGEEVIKIEKRSSDVESDIEVDIGSDNDVRTKRSQCKLSPKYIAFEEQENSTEKEDIVVHQEKDAISKQEITVTSQRSLERLLKGKVKIDLEGGGGCTIAHTAAGDVYAVSREPRRRPTTRAAAAPPVALIHTRPYSRDKLAPFTVSLYVSALISMDVQAHCSRGEVMGLLGGALRADASSRRLLVRAYSPAAAAASGTHCDMCPVSQALAAEKLRNAGLELVGWHHSHPRFPPNPSSQDLSTQLQLQQALERPRVPCLGIITSQHWPVGREASQYKCIRAELDASGQEVGYQLCARLQADLTEQTVPDFLQQLRDMLKDETYINEFTVNPVKEVCPDAKITYLRKCLSSVRHHLRSAGYVDQSPITTRLLRGIADIFR